MSSKKEKPEEEMIDPKQVVIEPEEELEAPEAEPEEAAEAKENKIEDKKEKKQKKESKKDREAELKETAEKLIQAEKEKYLRLCAEYDNFRKRSQRERDTLYTDIKADTLLKFLPVYDNLERALATPTEDEAYRRGVEMIMTQFCATMQKLGITEIEALGQKFDPNVHNAVMHIEDESLGKNVVAQVFQSGYRRGDRILRHAMVQQAN